MSDLNPAHYNELMDEVATVSWVIEHSSLTHIVVDTYPMIEAKLRHSLLLLKQVYKEIEELKEKC
jgi:hypothetical protein